MTLQLVRLCRNGLHEMTDENILRTTDGAARCRACRKDQAADRKARAAAEADALMDDRDLPEGIDYELPAGNLGRRWLPEGKCAQDPKSHTQFFFEPLISDWATEYCEGCSVRNLCFAFAVIGKEQGVWGGTTEEQRAKLTLVQRLKVRQSYTPMYDEWLGKTEKNDDNRPTVSEPHFEPGREDVINRALEAQDMVLTAGNAGIGMFDQYKGGESWDSI